MIFEILVVGGPLAAGFLAAWDFTRRKLRFVDAAQTRSAPWIAGAVAAAAAAPVVWLLPFVGGATALALGAGVALGVKSGQKGRHLLSE